jgi:hypothetical protein
MSRIQYTDPAQLASNSDVFAGLVLGQAFGATAPSQPLGSVYNAPGYAFAFTNSTGVEPGSGAFVDAFGAFAPTINVPIASGDNADGLSQPTPTTQLLKVRPWARNQFHSWLMEGEVLHVYARGLCSGQLGATVVAVNTWEFNKLMEQKYSEKRAKDRDAASINPAALRPHTEKARVRNAMRRDDISLEFDPYSMASVLDHWNLGFGVQVEESRLSKNPQTQEIDFLSIDAAVSGGAYVKNIWGRHLVAGASLAFVLKRRLVLNAQGQLAYGAFALHPIVYYGRVPPDELHYQDVWGHAQRGHVVHVGVAMHARGQGLDADDNARVVALDGSNDMTGLDYFRRNRDTLTTSYVTLQPRKNGTFLRP